MMYKEIIVETTSEGADFVSDTFFSIGANGVTIADPNDIKEVLKDKRTWDYVDEHLLNNDQTAVKVSCFVSAEECEAKVSQIKEELAFYKGVDMGSLNITVKDYVDSNWLEEWKKYYKPVKAAAFTVVPKWVDYKASENELIIKIDPSMAFGTGEHESTRLCLTLMSELDFSGKQIIDVGTGSGILGIGAAKKGAASVYMCDIDSLSIKSACENAELNGVRDMVAIEESDLFQKTDKVADIMLANLTADILIRLSSGLPAHLKKGGYLICSGIIHIRKQQVIDTFAALGMRLAKQETMGEWDALMLERV